MQELGRAFATKYEKSENNITFSFSDLWQVQLS
jgi:hypothetical protein